MNNLRKTAVYIFIGVFIMSMVLVPFTPMANVESQVAAPTNIREALVEKYTNLLENDLPSEKMDPILASYMETGTLDEKVVTTTDGDIKVLLFVDQAFDTNTLADIAKVRWQLDLKLARVASIEVSSTGALKQLEAMGRIHYVMADVFLDQKLPDSSDDPVTDMFHINDVVGATGTHASSYDGDGVIVGVADTGIDFSQSDMRGTEYNNGTHAMSYDPSGYGLTEMVVANNTVVSNTTEWLEAGYLLTYESGGKYYLNVTGWDPVCNNGGGHRSLMGLAPPYGDGYPYGANIGFIGLYEWAWGPVNNASEFVYNEMWKDWEIPVPGAENYTFGWIQQQRNEGYAKVFATSMYYEGDIIIDWNSSLAWNMMWQDAINLQTIDLNTTVDRAAVLAGMDWSFEDDRLLGRVYNIGNNILYADGLHDGSGSMGLGSISWAYDDIGYLSHDYGLFPGITADGMAWNALYAGGTVDDSNHGHWTSAAIASQGAWDHDVYANGTTYKLPGVAPGAKIIFSKMLSTGGSLMADFWAAGFHLNATSGYWEYIGDGPSHKAHIVSNSWGWGPGAGYLQMRLYTMVYDIASVPDVMATGYPGTLFVFSSGNEGGDYGTSGTPGASFSVLTVGASITGHYYESEYGPNPQTDGQEIYFSSNGPGYTGLAKPDVMAPGYRGVNPQPSQNEWMGVPGYGGAYDTYTWWQGTSLACPIAAGVAALIMEAWATAHGSVMPSPQLTKDLVLSSATDLGYDPYIQGHGLVNAEAAIAAIESGAADEYYFESNSFQYYSDQIAEAWAYWIPDWAPWGGIYYEADWDTPVGLETSSMFFGTVERSGGTTVNLGVTGYDGTPAAMANFDTIEAWYYEELSRVSFAETTYKYNDTNTNVIRSGVFFLEDNATLTDFYAANYATISVAYDGADIAADLSIALFDWVDTDMNNEFNYWNFTTDVGDYIGMISRYYDQCNLMQMRIASTSGIASLFTGEPVLQVYGPADVDFEVTIQVWTKTPDVDVGWADGSTGIDFTLTVPSDAEYGAHEGMVTFIDASSGFQHEIPYSYMVEMNLDGPAATPMILVDGAGATLTPFDTGAVTTSFAYGTTGYDEAGGLTTFHIDIPYNVAINATALVMRATWINDGTVIDMYLRNELGSSPPLAQTDDGGGPFVPSPTGDKINTIIWDPGYLINGTYWFYYTAHVIDGTDVPEDVTITFQLYGPTGLSTADPGFTWTSNDHVSPTTINPNDVLVGDHIVIESSWNIPAVTGLPEYSVVTGTRLAFLSGLYETRTGTYADPQGTDAWPIPIEQTDFYVWETILGVTVDDITTVTLDAQDGSDPSFDVYMWEDTNLDTLVDATELTSGALLSVDNGGGGAVESGVFTAPASGSLAIRVFCWDWAYSGAHYLLTVDSRISLDVDSEAGSLEYTSFATYNFERNISFSVYLYCWTETDVAWILDYGTLRFENFFPPVVTVNAPIDLTGDLWNFTWTATDGNLYDTLYFSVWLSSDGGNTFQLRAQNITDTFFVWDADGFLIRDYIYRVRAYDVDATYLVDGVPLSAVDDPPTSYWPGAVGEDISDAFEAGNVEPPSSTTSTTSPTTPTSTQPPSDFDPLLIGLIGGIGVGVVILLILFLIRKK